MRKILICDDEAIIRQGIRKILETCDRDMEIRESVSYTHLDVYKRQPVTGITGRNSSPRPDRFRI